MVTAPGRREVVRYMRERGLSERRALSVVCMSASSLPYARVPDRNQELGEQILALAHGHRRYGAAMIYLNLRQQGVMVIHKCVERLYSEAGLQVRKRKKVPVGERQRLIRPE